MNDDTSEVVSDEDRPFTPAERKELRLILENDRRAKWLWATFRVWAVWGAAVVTGFIAFKDGLKAMLRGLVSS